MNDSRIKGQFQYTETATFGKDEATRRVVKRQLIGNLLEKVLEAFGEDIRVKTLDESIDYKQVETDLFVFTPKQLLDFVETMQHPENRVHIEVFLTEVINNRPKEKYK